ncbi:MAG: YdcF family protein [Pseudomonadota bacterium]
MNVSGMIYAVVRSAILPPASLFILFALGFAVRNKFPRCGRRLQVGSVLVLFIISTDIGACLLGNALENLEPPLSSAKGTGAQAIVVLTAGRVVGAPEYGGLDIPDYIALARMRYAAKLHRENQLPVLVSGGFGSQIGNKESLATLMARGLQDEFATPVKWLETESSNTAENAGLSAKILLPAGVSRILLVTDAMHMRRAKLAFEQQGLQVVAAPTMFLNDYDIRPAALLPGVENLRRSHYAIYEWLGLAWYAMFKSSEALAANAR